MNLLKKMLLCVIAGGLLFALSANSLAQDDSPNKCIPPNTKLTIAGVLKTAELTNELTKENQIVWILEIEPPQSQGEEKQNKIIYELRYRESKLEDLRSLINKNVIIDGEKPKNSGSPFGADGIIIINEIKAK